MMTQLVSDCFTVFYARFYCPKDEDANRFEALAELGHVRRETSGKIHGYAIAPLGLEVIESYSRRPDAG